MSETTPETTPGQPAAETGLDKEMLMQLVSKRTEAIRASKADRGGWFPPPNKEGEDYMCELVAFRPKTFRDKEGSTEAGFGIQLRIADEYQDPESGDSLLGKKFGSFFSFRDKVAWKAENILSALWNKDTTETETSLGEAVVNGPALVGQFYKVRVITSENPQYPPNIYINECLGTGQ